ncbi:MAG: cohesin domain-containing protein [Candidatus Ornithomonoglobus sp.]
MKRFICTIMVCILTVMGFTATAAENGKIFAGNVSAAPGGIVRVELNIENNPGMAIGKVKIGFDREKLVPSAVEKGEILNNCWQFTSNIDDPNTDAAELDFITVSWMNMTDITGDGQLAVIEFTAKEAASGDTEITVEINELANSAQQNITADSANGTVTFTKSGDNDTNEDIILAFSATTVTKTDTAIGGTVNVSVYSKNDINASFIYTIYDGDGVLKAVSVKNQPLRSGVNEVALGGLSAEADANRAYEVKVYMWDSMTGMNSLTDKPIVKVYQ